MDPTRCGPEPVGALTLPHRLAASTSRLRSVTWAFSSAITVRRSAAAQGYVRRRARRLCCTGHRGTAGRPCPGDEQRAVHTVMEIHLCGPNLARTLDVP